MLNYCAMTNIGIVGLGYVGLPLALAFAETGATVVGIDSDPDKLSKLNRGGSYVEDVPSGSVSEHLARGALRFSKDYTALR